MADSGGSGRLWTVFSLVSALIGAALAKKALDTGWKAATGKKPPANPADPDVDDGEAVAVGRRQRHRRRRWPGCSPQRRAADYYAKLHRPPAAAAAEGRASSARGTSGLRGDGRAAHG